ncbi:50S ribosomal protein L10 [archaeon SCG-AAA382B04]|nr:50S ribosomal protein L10 [archaeon SCG-AAA382B04]
MSSAKNVAQWKKDRVSQIASKINENEVIAIVDIEGIPAKQLQQMRSDLRGNSELLVSRNTLLKISLEQSNKEGIDKLEDYVEGQAGLLLTNDNPFRLYNVLEENKTKAPASAGDIAPQDIVIEKGSTSLKPGPVLGDLQKAGIPAAIDGGDVVIQETEVVKEEGEEIDSLLANMLKKLDIKPIEVGLRLKAVLEETTLFEPDDLKIDTEEYVSNIQKAFSDAFSLSVEATYPTKENITTILKNASIDSVSLGEQANVYEPEIVKKLIAMSDKQANSLSSNLDDFEAKT